jgi:hypothetical protein
VALDLHERVDERAAGDPKTVVRRLVEEVLNAGRLLVIDELYTPQMARGARRHSVRASPTCTCRSST